jgi:hypothetical protein
VVDLRARRPGFSTEALRTPQLRRTHSTGGRSRVLPDSLDEGGQFGIGERGIDRFGHAGQDATLTEAGQLREAADFTTGEPSLTWLN